MLEIMCGIYGTQHAYVSGMTNTSKTDAARISRIVQCQRRLLCDLAFSRTYRGSAASEDAIRLSIQQGLVEVMSYDTDTYRPRVKLTRAGARIQSKL